MEQFVVGEQWHLVGVASKTEILVLLEIIQFFFLNTAPFTIKINSDLIRKIIKKCLKCIQL